jgi:hypothetical protein
MGDNPETDAEFEEERQEMEEEVDANMEEEKDEDMPEKADEDAEVEEIQDDDEKKAEETKEDETKEQETKEAEPPASKEPEAAKELEEDAPADSRAGLAAGAVSINAANTLLNAMISCEGKILMALSEGGMQHLLATAQCNTGVKAGRYMFEVKIIENRTPMNSGGKYEPMPRQLLRIGLSTSTSSLFLESSECGICFDSEGNFGHGTTRERSGGRKWHTYQVLAVLLNLDANSPNANTVSLFADGRRVTPPKALPESLKGKTLYPTINYKNMTLHANFGPEPFAPLPFKCRMVQDAAKADTEESAMKQTENREVLFPVCIPDQGTFSWLDDFLQENPQCVELSNRAILSWAEKSNIYRSGGYSWKHCNDFPGWDFGVREMDDNSIKKLIGTVAPVLPRSYVVMEVQGNLTAIEREKALTHFDDPKVKKVAVVVMGEPPDSFKAKVHADLLEKKRAQAEADAKTAFEQKAKDSEKAKKDKDKTKKDGEDEVENLDDDEEKETLEEAVAKARKAVELSEEDKEQWFLKPAKEGDVNFKDLSSTFSSYTIPTKEEGFDEIRYVWQSAEASSAYLKKWILEQKLTQRVEDMEPGSWFKEQWSEWDRLVRDWKQKQNDFKDSSRRPHSRYNGARKHEEKKEVKKDDKKEEEKNEEEKDGMEDGEADEKEKEEKEEKEEEEKEEAAPIVTEDLDVWTVQDVCDVGNGEPLFANFGHEDWTLLSLRFELHLLVHAFRHDMDDPERASFHEQHLMFYHNKYYRKECNPKWYGCSSATALLQMLKDTIEMNSKSSILENMLSDDTPLENFIRLTEDERRERQRRIDAGDEDAALNISRPQGSASRSHYDNNKGRSSGGKGYERGHGKPDHGRGGYSDRGGGRDSDRGGHSSRPQAPGGYSRGAPAPARGGPPPSAPRHDSRGGGGVGRYGATPPGRSHGGHGDHGRDSRYGGGAPTASRGGSYGPPPPSSYSSQKRSHPPPSLPPVKHSRSDRGPPPSRGAPPSHGSRGASGGGYRR